MKEKYYLLKSKIKELIAIITTYKRHIEEMNHYPDKSAVLWGVPEHENLGDQAITYAEVEFIKKWLGVENVFMIPEKRCIEYIYPLKKLSAKKKWHLFLMGGGNMGEMYR